MSKEITIDIFDPKSIQNAIKQIELYQKELQQKVRLLCQKLASHGVTIAKAQVVDLDAVFTGELLGSIHYEKVRETKHTAVFSIVADSEHAIYVEIGTGIVGSKHPYVGALPVMYAQGKTIRQLSNGKYGWFYQLNGKWVFTEGMESRPFMWDTSLELQQRIISVAKEVFG